ncbi:phenylacetate--CoA ligase family protein [Chloroflexota bacterium]
MAITGKGDEYFDELEVMSAAARQAYFDKKLAETVDNVYRNAPAIRDIFDRAGVGPSLVRTVKDLELLPVTRKTDLIELQKKKPPYGGFSVIPPEDVERVFLSPGPIYEPIQHSGIKWFAKSFWAAGFRKGDMAVNTFTYHLSPAGILFHEALVDCGATVIPMGTGNTEILVQTMHDLKVNGFVGTPTFLMTVIKKAGETGYNFKKDFALQKAWFTGEPLPPSLREVFEKEYNINTAQAYAVTEPGGAIAYECSQKSGMHLMDEYITEIVDPETGRQLGPGEVGEIVVTPIHNRTWGLIRFGTGDMSSYITDPCPCGRTAYKMTGIVGRTADAVKVRGMFVVARQVEQAIAEFKQVSRFRMLVARSGHRDEMTLQAELADASMAGDKLADELNKRIQQLCRVRADRVEFVEPGTIPEDRQTITDARTWK